MVRDLSELGGDRAAAASSVEWLAKLSLLEGYRQRDGLGWNNRAAGPRGPAVGRHPPEKGSTTGCWPATGCSESSDDAAIARAVTEPPSDTRAYFRGRCVSRFGADLAGASWDSVIFDVPGRGRLQRVPTREPLRGTEALTGGLFARHREAGPFLAELLGLSPGS